VVDAGRRDGVLLVEAFRGPGDDPDGGGVQDVKGSVVAARLGDGHLERLLVVGGAVHPDDDSTAGLGSGLGHDSSSVI
jgi:hypothetical protein